MSVGLPRAKELIFSGRQLTAAEAFTMGLVNKVTTSQNLMNEVMETAKMISSRAPVAVWKSKMACQSGYDLGLTDGLKMEAKLFGELFLTDDMREGTKAFVEKRQANFAGR